MSRITHFKGVSGIDGLYVGKKGREVLVADATGSPAKNAVVMLPLGAIADTTNVCAFTAPAAGTLKACKIVTKDAIAKSDTDYWTVALVDKGATGTGTSKIAEKTTKAKGGEAFAAYKAWDIGTLSTTHKVLAAGDVVCLSFTKSGTPVSFAEAAAMLEFVYA